MTLETLLILFNSVNANISQTCFLKRALLSCLRSSTFCTYKTFHICRFLLLKCTHCNKNVRQSYRGNPCRVQLIYSSKYRLTQKYTLVVLCSCISCQTKGLYTIQALSRYLFLYCQGINVHSTYCKGLKRNVNKVDSSFQILAIVCVIQNQPTLVSKEQFTSTCTRCHSFKQSSAN